MKKQLELSPKCTTAQIKANTGRNRQIELLSGIDALYPKTWSIQERINYKSFYADPAQYYRERKQIS